MKVCRFVDHQLERWSANPVLLPHINTRYSEVFKILFVGYPHHVNTSCGYYLTPLIVALAREHLETAKFLHHNGAHPNAQGHYERTPLHFAVWYGDLEIVRRLLGYK